MFRTAAVTLAFAAVLALTAACGDDDDTPAPAASPTTAAATPAAASPTVPPTPACPPQQTTGLMQLTVQAASQAQGVALMDDVQHSTTNCYDRIVFQFDATAGLPGYTVNYVTSAAQCGSGMPVTTQGPAQLQVQFLPADAHDQNGNSTLPSRAFTVSYPSVKEAVVTCDFEADVTWIIGTELRAFTVTTQPSPPQVIVDIYH